MRHLWWGLIPFVAALMAIRTWWAELADIVGLVALVCGLAYVVYSHSAANPASTGRTGTRQAGRPARLTSTARLTHYRTQKVPLYDPSHPPRPPLPPHPRHVGLVRGRVGVVGANPGPLGSLGGSPTGRRVVPGEPNRRS